MNGQEHSKEEMSPKERLTRYTESEGLRNTAERYAVLEAVTRQKGLFTALEIYRYLLSEMSFHVSVATVYAALDVITEAGIIVEHFFGRRGAKYELTGDRTTFNYMICSSCGRITPIKDPSYERAVKLVRTPRLHVTHSKTYVYGICATCASNRKKKLKEKLQQKDNGKRKS